MSYKYVFWDWNGTLFDDATASWLAVNDMLGKRNLPKISFEQYRDYVDVPIIKFYEKVLDVSKENMESLSAEFHSLCYEHLPDCPLSHKAKETLEFLHNKGVNQYIFSSSHSKRIVPCLERLGIARYFDAVLGADDCYAGSKIERTENYIRQNGISPDESLFVGDLVHDSEVALAIGADCILVSSGHQSKKTLSETGGTVVATLEELLNKFSHEVFLC